MKQNMNSVQAKHTTMVLLYLGSDERPSAGATGCIATTLLPHQHEDGTDTMMRH